MTYKEWEKKLLSYLKPFQKEEREAAVEYYREMYGDKLDAGIPAEDILREFGEPSVCAERILSENGMSLPKPKSGNRPFAWWLGTFFFTLLIIIPVYAAIFSVIVTFAAMIVGGAAIALGGAVYTVYSPFMAIGGMGFPAVIAHMGMGIALAGCGLALFVAFLYLTKYSYKWTVKSLVLIYAGRSKV